MKIGEKLEKAHEYIVNSYYISDENLNHLESGKSRSEEKFKEKEIDTVKINEYLKAFREWYDKYEYDKYISFLSSSSAYNYAKEIKEITYNLPELNQEDIQKIIEEIEKSVDTPEKSVYKAGIFISYLINECCPEEEIEIEVGKSYYLLDYLGLYNKKVLTIYGNVGDVLGREMKKGKITVKGNANDWVGEEMKGGKIIVEGNAGNGVGYGMEGGIIDIKGYADYYVGSGMRGGKIYLEKDYKSISSDIRGGEIYHKGELVI